jgi:2,3-dihydroxybenzoate-AMP ligase
MSFVSLLDESVGRWPGKVVLIDGSRDWRTFSAFSNAVWGVARGLAAAGVSPRDRIALHMPN